MSEVKRYIQHRCTEMTEVSSGDYVLHSDYEKLEARLKIAVEALTKYETLSTYFKDLNERQKFIQDRYLNTMKVLKELRGE